MHIVITRPKEDSLHLAENLIKLGHVVTNLPVIKIEKLQTKKINLLNYEAVIFTSSNAIKFMNIEKFNLKIKCFCVGKATEDTAKKVGAVNWIFNDKGTLTGHNTDCTGFIRSLKDQTGFDPNSKKALIFGAGGASRAIIYGLITSGIKEINITNRTKTNALKIQKDFSNDNTNINTKQSSITISSFRKLVGREIS